MFGKTSTDLPAATVTSITVSQVQLQHNGSGQIGSVMLPTMMTAVPVSH